MDANGVLEMRPDFNEKRPPYRIETSFGEIFEFTLEHASLPITRAEREREVLLYQGEIHQYSVGCLLTVICFRAVLPPL